MDSSPKVAGLRDDVIMDDRESIAFWSYAHSDDEHENGRISRLAKLIADEYELLSGEKLEMFTDHDIKWGEAWKDRVDSALQTTTFFIPILSPGFFRSDECRREFLEFYNKAKSLGVSEYLLALRYIPVRDMVPDSSEAILAVAAQTQYVPWDALRLMDETSAEYRTAVNSLAVRLLELSEAVSAQPSVTPEEVAEAAVAEDEGRGEIDPYDMSTPGSMEVAAAIPEQLSEMTATLDLLVKLAGEFSAPLQEATPRLAATDSFAEKILIARQVAAQLEGPSKALEDAGAEYTKILLATDPNIRALYDAVDPESQEEGLAASLDTTATSLETLVGNAREAARQTSDSISAGRNLAKAMRDLRPALKRYESGQRNIVDGVAILAEWAAIARRAADDFGHPKDQEAE